LADAFPGLGKDRVDTLGMRVGIHDAGIFSGPR
jgi:hypothetical protein